MCSRAGGSAYLCRVQSGDSDEADVCAAIAVKTRSNFWSSPLERTPYFSADSFAGYGAYVRQNGTAVSIAIKQLVLANNALQSAYIPYHVAQASKASISFVRDC